MNPRFLSISDYSYNLPESKIAQFPTELRDESKLLIYKDGAISTDIFKQVSNYLPGNSLMIFNETKVIHARMIFKKPTGAKIEVFLLEPWGKNSTMELALSATNFCEWKCFVGNAKKWKEDMLSKLIVVGEAEIYLRIMKRYDSDSTLIISFLWEGDVNFGEIIELDGFIPLPPYMKRDSVDSDSSRYQTVYANKQGSVAAPTAGLHFTPEVFLELDKIKVKRDFISLNVGAGTFKPVSTDLMNDHEMHVEKIFISRKVIRDILDFKQNGIIAVGTTTTRTLESLYWFGVMLSVDSKSQFVINQWYPYENDNNLSIQNSLKFVLRKMDDEGIDFISGESNLIIAPGYRFRVIDVLITNFHQPKSTLLLLVSALIGDNWKNIYNYALDNDFRFLSYGDSCLIFP